MQCSILGKLCSIINNILSCNIADNIDNVGLINEICINYKCLAIAYFTLLPKYCLIFYMHVYFCNMIVLYVFTHSEAHEITPKLLLRELCRHKFRINVIKYDRMDR